MSSIVDSTVLLGCISKRQGHYSQKLHNVKKNIQFLSKTALFEQNTYRTV